MNGVQVDSIADTSVLIGLSRRNPALNPTVGGRNFAITFISVAELTLGLLKASKRHAAWKRIEEVMHGRVVFYPSRFTPLIYTDVCHDLERKGVRIPSNDMWIAAVAVESGLPLLARDEHFARIEALELIAC